MCKDRFYIFIVLTGESRRYSSERGGSRTRSEREKYDFARFGGCRNSASSNATSYLNKSDGKYESSEWITMELFFYR